MLRLLILAGFLQCTISQQYQQKVAPGVPPQNYQNYQQPPPPQPIQQQPPPQQQQYQQPPQQQQYQQPPQQQYQQQVPVQQMPVQNSHGNHGGHDPQLLNAANIAQEREHIQEHMEVPIDTSKMTEQELQFHYFKMHDADNNNKLDGCELIKSLIHWHEPNGKEKEVLLKYKDEDLQEIVEGALKQADKNNDGYIDYVEYRSVTT
ncbi:multiple coagulation factor deficiency protein 2 homolog isoform X2 [Nymphalis io]|uniref:multiple coagulation factor deficiency protein 2 homolog isoform X2 n=1 Tax=Inachis io TaxID=171585 RepID=UPI0021670A9F|nr:multiple coagulation factor deficiency protein 2 homolog isoform X2 [Nymphalis io]